MLLPDLSAFGVEITLLFGTSVVSVCSVDEATFSSDSFAFDRIDTDVVDGGRLFVVWVASVVGAGVVDVIVDGAEVDEGKIGVVSSSSLSPSNPQSKKLFSVSSKSLLPDPIMTHYYIYIACVCFFYFCPHILIYLLPC